jgi:RimJ/RimL family protein N-acetyltransferase
MSELRKRLVLETDIVFWKNNINPQMTEDDFAKLLQQIRDDQDRDKSYSFMLEDEGRTVGFIQIFGILRGPFMSGSIEVMIDKNERKKGLGKTAIEVLKDFCFNELGLLKIYGYIHPDNTASMALAKSLGAEDIGIDPYAYFINKKAEPHREYVCLNPMVNKS